MGIDRTFASDPFWDRSPGTAKGSYVGFFKEYLKVRRQTYDRIYLTSTCWRSAMVAWTLNSKEVVGFAGKKNRWFLDTIKATPDRKQPVMEEILRLVSNESKPEAVYQFQSKPPALPLPKQGKLLVGLHPFAGSKKRCAPLEFWFALAQTLESANRQVLWFGTKRELEDMMEEHPDQKEKSLLNYSNHPDLILVAAAMNGLDLFVGHDSGPLHVAGAFKVPVFGLYLPGEPQRTFPQGAGPKKMIVANSPADLDFPSAIAEINDFLTSL